MYIIQTTNYTIEKEWQHIFGSGYILIIANSDDFGGECGGNADSMLRDCCKEGLF